LVVPVRAPPIPNDALSERALGVAFSRAVVSVTPGPTRAPTLLSFDSSAAHVWLFASLAADCARTKAGDIAMSDVPQTSTVYIFDLERMMLPRNKNHGVQHPCLTPIGRAFCNSPSTLVGL
jgi:hypothetical protein